MVLTIQSMQFDSKGQGAPAELLLTEESLKILEENKLSISRDASSGALIISRSPQAEQLRRCQLTSNFVAVTGIGFGDEGKGRAIPELVKFLNQQLEREDAVALVFKVNGGANSGHTAAGLTLNLLPCGVAIRECPKVGLGQGVVADPIKLSWETRLVENFHGLPVENRLVIDPKTMVSHILHRLEDKAQEYYREHVLGLPIRGSTCRGITPAFTDEVSQNAIYYHHYLNGADKFSVLLLARAELCIQTIKHVYQVPETAFYEFFSELTAKEVRAHEKYGDVFTDSDFDLTVFRGPNYSINTEALVERYWEQCEFLYDKIAPLAPLIREADSNNQFVIGEFGQAYLLGRRTGFPPNVTASHPYTSEMYSSGQISTIKQIHNITCAKAYDTKVGTHLFISEIEHSNPLHAILSKIEFGTTTGRQRAVGWFDAVEKAHTFVHGGFQDLVINKLDALTETEDWRGPLKICVGYQELCGRINRTLPVDDEFRSTLKPVYAEFPTWSEDIRSARSFNELPENARRYVRAMYTSVCTIALAQGADPATLPRIRYIGVGPNPDEIVRGVPGPLELFDRNLSVVLGYDTDLFVA